MSFKFFHTAPKTKSDKVFDIEKDGNSSLLLEAVENERRSKSHNGHSENESGQVEVKRVGSNQPSNKR